MVLQTAEWTDRKRWAEPGDLNRCILRSCCRTSRCGTSARLFFRGPCSCRAVGPISVNPAPYDRSPSVVISAGAKPCFRSDLPVRGQDTKVL